MPEAITLNTMLKKREESESAQLDSLQILGSMWGYGNILREDSIGESPKEVANVLTRGKDVALSKK